MPRTWESLGANKYRLRNNFKFLRDEYGKVGQDRVIQLYANGLDTGAPEEDIAQLNKNNEWFMNLATPQIQYYNDTTSPNDMIMELGEDWGDLITRFRRKASRIIESIVGFKIAREIMKDREGNYPTSIIHATALKTTLLFIKAYNPNSPDVTSLEAEFDDIMNKILSGKMIMTGHRSENDSKGTIRFVEIGTENYNVYPVELKGRYSGNQYELLHLYFMGYNNSGHAAYKELTYWVKGKSSNKLVDTVLIEETLINYDYQDLGVGNLQVRFATGDLDVLLYAVGSVTEIFGGGLSTPITYEIELWGSDIQPTISEIKPTTLSRNILWH